MQTEEHIAQVNWEIFQADFSDLKDNKANEFLNP